MIYIAECGSTSPTLLNHETMSGFTDGFGNLGSFAGSNLAAAGSNLVSGAIGQLFAGMNARRNWKYKQKEMNLEQQYNLENMQKQFEYQQQAWQNENEYNDPRNAVMRWRLAGISPNAVYGNSPGGAGISGSAGTPDSTTPSGAGNVDNSHYSPTTTPVEQMQLKMAKELNDAQIDKLAAEAAKLRGDTKDPEESARNLWLINKGLEIDNETKAVKKRILDIQAKYEDAKNQNDLDIQYGIYVKMLAEIDKLVADKNLTEATRLNLIEDRKKIQAEVNLLKEKVKTEKATQKNLNSGAEYYAAQTKTEDDLRELRQGLTDAQRKEALQRIRESKVLSAKGVEELYAWLKGDRPVYTLYGLVDKYVTGAGKMVAEQRYNSNVHNYLYDLLANDYGD